MLTIFLLIFGLLGFCVLAAVERENLHAAVSEVVNFAVRVVNVITGTVATVVVKTTQFLRDQLWHEEDSEAAPADMNAPRSESASSGAGVSQGEEADASTAQSEEHAAPTRRRVHPYLSRIIGALLLAALTAVFVTSEYYLLVLCLGPMGFGSGESKVPLSADWLSAMAMLGVAIFWGIVLFEMHRVGDLLPRQMTRGRLRNVLLVMSYVCLTTTVVVAALVGYWRGTQAVQTHDMMKSTTNVPDSSFDGAIEMGTGKIGTGEEPAAAMPQPGPVVVGDGSGLARIVPQVFGTALPALVAISSAVSFFGVIHTLRYLSVLLTGIGLLPFLLVLIVLRCVSEVLGTLLLLIERVLGLCGRVGSEIVHGIRGFRRQPDGGEAEVSVAGAAAATVASEPFTSHQGTDASAEPPTNGRAKASASPEPDSGQNSTHPDGDRGEPEAPRPQEGSEEYERDSEAWDPLGMGSTENKKEAKPT